MSHIWEQGLVGSLHITYIYNRKESCHTSEGVMSHIWRQGPVGTLHVTCLLRQRVLDSFTCGSQRPVGTLSTKEPWGTWYPTCVYHIYDKRESCHTSEGVMSHIWRQGPVGTLHVYHIYDKRESCHTCEMIMSHIWRHGLVGTLHIWRSHVTHHINLKARTHSLDILSCQYKQKNPYWLWRIWRLDDNVALQLLAAQRLDAHTVTYLWNHIYVFCMGESDASSIDHLVMKELVSAPPRYHSVIKGVGEQFVILDQNRVSFARLRVFTTENEIAVNDCFLNPQLVPGLERIKLVQSNFKLVSC